jgi:tripartite-type tricarboxylate transporter receptor subunit TctC
MNLYGVTVGRCGAVLAGFGLGFGLLLTGPANSAEQPFYQGKTLQIVVGFDAGGGYDAYARLIGRTLPKYIPGNPTIVVQNKPGAGSRVAANWLYNIAPRDGTVIGSVVQSTPLDQIFQETGVMYDAAQFSWIGNPIVDNLVSISSRQSGLTSLDLVKSKGGLICGSSGAGPTVTFANAIGKILSSPVRVVSGYPGVSAVTLAMQRNEVNCNAGQAWSSMKATMAQLMREGQLNVMVQWGTDADPDIAAVAGHDVPLITNYARSDADRGALRLLSSTSPLSRPLLAPPGLPAERVAVLRAAFDKTMTDPAFLEDAKRSGMDIKPIAGAAIQTLVGDVVHSPRVDVEAAQKLAQ